MVISYFIALVVALIMVMGCCRCVSRHAMCCDRVCS